MRALMHIVANADVAGRACILTVEQKQIVHAWRKDLVCQKRLYHDMEQLDCPTFPVPWDTTQYCMSKWHHKSKACLGPWAAGLHQRSTQQPGFPSIHESAFSAGLDHAQALQENSGP